MIKQLYKIFQHWSDGGSCFIYSDPHFVGSELDQDEINMRKLFNYGSNELQIENINKVVCKNDWLIILGDVGSPKILEQLKCKNIVLIKGNHDKGNENYEKYCKEIYSGILAISDKVVLSHEPLVKELKERGLFNICGHIHNQFEIDDLHKEGYNNFLCIAANMHNYEPINLGDLFNRKGEFKDFTGLSECQGIHRITIDNAAARKRKRRNLNEESFW